MFVGALKLLKQGKNLPMSTIKLFQTGNQVQIYKRVRDIYKQIDYTAPFSWEESQLILEKINKANDAEIKLFVSKKHAENIIEHRKAVGDFKAVEQLLDVKKFEAKTIEKLGKNIIRYQVNDNDGDLEAFVKASKLELDMKKLQKNVRPKISPHYYNSNEVQTITGIKFNLNTLAFAQIQKTERKLLGWNELEVFEDGTNVQFEHHFVNQKAQDIVNLIPKSDIYVFEDPPPIMYKKIDPFLFHKIKMLEFQCFLTCLLNSRGSERASGFNRIYTMKINIVDDLFRLRVGSERIAINKKLQDMLKDKWEKKHKLAIDIPHDRWIDFYQLADGRSREQLSIALLAAIAFDHLHKV